jgi:hypothetical protein
VMGYLGLEVKMVKMAVTEKMVVMVRMAMV